MKRIIAITIVAAALLLGGTAAHADPKMKAACRSMSEISYMAAQWRDAGMSQSTSIKQFQREWKRIARDKGGNPADVAWIYDAAIPYLEMAYDEPAKSPEAVRRLAYTFCEEEHEDSNEELN